MKVSMVKWVGAMTMLTLVGIAGALGHIMLAKELGAASYLLLAGMATVLGLGLGYVAVDVNQRHQKEIERHNEELSALNAVAVTASRSLELSAVLHDCLDKTIEVMKLDAGAVFLAAEDGKAVQAAHRGFAEEYLHDLAQARIDEGASDAVIVPEKSRTIHAGSQRLHATLRVPLRCEGRVLGVMYLASKVYRAFTSREVQILVSIGDVIGMAVQNAKLHAQVKEHATHDALTGLYNRRFFDQIYDQELGRANRYDTTLAAAMIDINNFKQINDRYGHKTGDLALEAIGHILRNGRSSDTAARYGGDEFVIMMPNTDVHGAAAVAERIRRAATTAEIPGAPDLTLDLSIGVADSTEGYEHILERADARMYEEKRKLHVQR
ncbi:MAG TPA: sensor domain-containing diguanylate cyclase [Armatimonadota bacterium]|nr:sensor domain-containing diguanylate cyclase [Armatimonadota bacterium]